MYWILVIMAAIAASLIALVVGGLVTPAEYRVIRSIRLQVSAHDVGTLLADLAAYAIWAPSPMSITRDAAPHGDHIVLQVRDDDTASQMQWEWRVDAEPTGSRVTLAESGRVGNPVIRFFAALRGHGGNAERTLRGLAEHLGEFGVLVERA
jgi:hypothetical protein